MYGSMYRAIPMISHNPIPEYYFLIVYVIIKMPPVPITCVTNEEGQTSHLMLGDSTTNEVPLSTTGLTIDANDPLQIIYYDTSNPLANQPLSILADTCYSIQLCAPNTNLTLIDRDGVPQNFPNTLPGIYYFSIDSETGMITFGSEACCVAASTLVMTGRGDLPIKDVMAGDQVFTDTGEPHDVVYNIEFVPARDFVCIKKHALGIDKPQNDVLIRAGHPLLVNGIEVMCDELIDGTTIYNILQANTSVYSLCTKKRIAVMMENIPIFTWSQDEWEKRVSKNNIVTWRH
jgi:hypothetical protein